MAQIAGAVEDISVAYLNNKPRMQERLVAEALRWVERSFAGFSMVAGDRCVVSCTGIEKQGTRRNSDDTITASLVLTFDVHYAKAVHVLAVARVPVEARLRVEVQTLKRGDGSRRRIAVVNMQAPPIDFDKLELTAANGSEVGTADLEFVGSLLGQWLLNKNVNPKLRAGFTLFWEQSRGSCLFPSAVKQSGEKFAWLEASDIDAEPVRKMLQEVEDAAWTGRLVQIPPANAGEGVEGLRVVGGGSAADATNAYYYRFPVGVFPIVGLDKGLLTAFQALGRAASGKLVQQQDGYVLERPSKIRVRAETNKGTVKLCVAGPRNKSVLAWREVTAESPLDVEVDIPAGMATLWVVNEAERVTEELTAPTLKLTVEDVRVGRAPAGDFVGTWRALIDDGSGGTLRCDLACLEEPAKCGVRVLSDGNTETARATGTWKVEEDKLLITEANDTVTTLPYRLIGTHLRLAVGGKELVFERVR